MHLFLFLVVAIIWSASFILMKRAGDCFGPLTIAGLRVAGAVLVLGTYLLWRKRLLLPDRSQAFLLSIVIVVGYVIPYALQPYLVGIFGSAFVGTVVSFVPIITILVSMPILSLYPNRWQVMGVLFGLCCIFIVMADGFQRLDNAAWWLLVLPIVVPGSYAVTNTLVRRHFREVSPVLLSTWCFFAAALILLPWGFLTEPIHQQGDMRTAIVAVAILGVLGTGLCMAIFYHLIQQRGPLYAGMVSYVIPIGAMIIGALDGEDISRTQVLAIIGIISMVFLVQRNTQV